MAVPTAPDLELLLTTPFRLRVLATGDFEAEEVTDLTFQVSTVSDFASTLDSSEVQVQDYEYAIAEGNRDDTLYVRAKATNDEGDSSWSSTLTVAAIAKPTAPTLATRDSAPQRIAVGATDLDDKTFRVTFQFSKSSSFATTAWETFVEAGPAVAEYRVPSADRRTTHYVRAKVGYIADVDTDTDDELFWESDWSNSVTVTGAGRLDSDDIVSVALSKISGRGAVAEAPYNGLYDPNGQVSAPLNRTNSSTTTFTTSNLRATIVNDTRYKFQITAAIAYNAQTDLKFKLVAPGDQMDGAAYVLRYGSGTLASAEASSSSLTTTFYYGDAHVPPTITVTQSGSSTASEYITFVQFDGSFYAAGDGTFALAFAANTTPTGKYPTIVTGSVLVEQMPAVGE